MKCTWIAGMALGISGAAQGAVFFTFDDPGTTREISYTEPDAGETFGLLKYDSNVALDLVVDLVEEGGGVLNFSDATFTKTAMVGEVTTSVVPGVGTIYSAPVSGEFAFEAGGETILTGSYSNAVLSIINDVGIKAASIQTGSLSYQASGSLATNLSMLNKILFAPFDAAFTLTGVTGVATSNPDGDPEGPQYFRTFWANAAYTGTSGTAIPTQGSAALLLTAGLVTARRRRRG